jgi:down-regulator of transcription 1
MADDDEFAGQSAAAEDVSLPKATVNKFANEVAAGLDVRLTMDTRELVAECCCEFVQLLSSEANEICEKDSKKTITPEHILRALKQLGFERYHKEVSDEFDRVKADDQRGRTRDKAKKERKKNVPTEELLALQEALFAKAREDPMNVDADPS